MPNKASPKGVSTQDVAAGTAQSTGSWSRSAMRAVVVVLVRHEIRNLRRWFDEFDRDILLPILLGEIGLHNIGALENSSAKSVADTPDGQEPVLADGLMSQARFRPCNAYSIAAATGLPRETVRRKIVRLVELGWVTRRDNGHLFITAAALEHFGAVLSSRELIEMIDTADRLRALMAEHEPAEAPPRDAE
jgi:hypothetical protein